MDSENYKQTPHLAFPGGSLHHLYMSGKVTLKYALDIQQCGHQNCPPVECQGVLLSAFRFTYDPDPTPTPQSYLPPAKKISAERRWQGTVPDCSDFALSLFRTESEARIFFKKLEKKNKNIRKSLGNFLAVVAVDPKHGLAGEFRTDGHFNLYEYQGVDLSLVASPIGFL